MRDRYWSIEVYEEAASPEDAAAQVKQLFEELPLFGDRTPFEIGMVRPVPPATS